MSSADYDRYDDRRQRSHRHRDDREPARYVETKETYIRSPVAPAVPDVPYASTRTTELIRRPVREDSDLSVEEVRRDFPPPTSAGYAPRYDRYAPSYRSHSAERDYERGQRRSRNDFDDRRGRNTAVYAEEHVVKPRRRSLSRNQKVIAGVAGAALAVGSKELWDRRQAGDRRPVARNPLQTAAAGVAGAFVAYEGAELYAKHGPGAEKAKVKTYVAHKGRDGHVEEYYASDEETVRPKRSKSRSKSFIEGALGLAGIGAGAKALGGRDRDGRSRRGSDGSYDSRGRARSPENVAKFQQAAKAALLAGATEAFRVRNEPGGWGGEKGKRILTAAIGAGGVNAAADRNPEDHSKRHILESVVTGLAGNRLINGSRKDVDVDDDGKSIRSRSRSRSRGGGSGPTQGLGLAALATAGLGALAGKKALDRSRSRSRAGGRRSRRSPDSYNSRSPSPSYGDRRPKRSKSVSDYARKGLAALGLAGAGAAVAGRDRDRGEVIEQTTVRKSRRGDSDGGYSPRRSRNGNSSRDLGYADSRDDGYGDPRHGDSRSSAGGKHRSRRDQPGYNRRVAEGKESATDSDSSLGSSTDDEKKIKKMKGKQLITAGLASVATIHAAHGVYQSMEKREARKKAVAEGDMTPEEARKLKAKATLQDAASIGIAALGIKGAYSEIKEVNEMRGSIKDLRTQKEKRHQKRLERLQREDGSGGGISRRRTEPPSSRYDDQPRYNDQPHYENQQRYDDRRDYGPQYTDANPYAYSRAETLPAPPVGYDRR